MGFAETPEEGFDGSLNVIVTGFNSGEEVGTRYCSFCGKSEFDVPHLIVTHTVYKSLPPVIGICSECVGLCIELLKDEDPEYLEKLVQAK